MKKISQEELNLILENHKLWLKDDSKGEQADLSSCDLSSCDLSNANLFSADLIYANLFSANLSNANLSHANLFSANLSYANLSNANLSNTKLSSADLFNTNLSNTNLTNLASFNFALRSTITDKTYFQILNIGSREGITTYCVDDTHIFCGCWKDYKGGSLEEFEKRIEEVYGKCEEEPNKKYYNEYMNAIKYFKLCKSEE